MFQVNTLAINPAVHSTFLSGDLRKLRKKEVLVGLTISVMMYLPTPVVEHVAPAPAISAGGVEDGNQCGHACVMTICVQMDTDIHQIQGDGEPSTLGSRVCALDPLPLPPKKKVVSVAIRLWIRVCKAEKSRSIVSALTASPIMIGSPVHPFIVRRGEDSTSQDNKVASKES